MNVLVLGRLFLIHCSSSNACGCDWSAREVQMVRDALGQLASRRWIDPAAQLARTIAARNGKVTWCAFDRYCDTNDSIEDTSECV